MNSRYITPVVTVLDKNGNLDKENQGKLYDYLIEQGVSGLLLLGSIGEFFALSMETKKELISFACEYINKRTEVIIGTTSMEVNEIVKLSDYAISCGADAVIIIPPYYFSMSDESVYQYYDYLASSIQGNIYLYNFPDRTGYSISNEVTLRLVKKHKNIIGYKDTISGVDHTRELIKLVKTEFPEFRIYSGFDDNFARNVLSGGDGCIGGLSNLFPDVCAAWIKAFADNDLCEVSKIQQKIDQLMDIYKVGTPFVPYIKCALQLKGVIDNNFVTFPLPTPNEEERAELVRIIHY